MIWDAQPPSAEEEEDLALTRLVVTVYNDPLTTSGPDRTPGLMPPPHTTMSRPDTMGTDRTLRGRGLHRRSRSRNGHWEARWERTRQAQTCLNPAWPQPRPRRTTRSTPSRPTARAAGEKEDAHDKANATPRRAHRHDGARRERRRQRPTQRQRRATAASSDSPTSGDRRSPAGAAPSRQNEPPAKQATQPRRPTQASGQGKGQSATPSATPGRAPSKLSTTPSRQGHEPQEQPARVTGPGAARTGARPRRPEPGKHSLGPG